MGGTEMLQQDVLEFDLPRRSDCWMVAFDQEQRIMTSNEESFELLGKRPEELIGQKLGAVMNLGLLNSLFMKGCCFQGQPVWLGGQRLQCDFSPLERQNKAVGGVLSFVRSEQGEIDSPAMQDIFSSMDLITDIAQESLILVNQDGIITMINQPFADALGLRAKDMIGGLIHQSYPNSNPSRLPVVMDTGQAEIGEPHLLNGAHVVVSRYPLLKNGEMLGAFGKILFRDIREVSRLADKLHVVISNNAPHPAERKNRHHDFKYDANSIIGHSKVMKDLKEKLLRIAQRCSNVLLTGESGTGKELFAHAIHAASPRRFAPFVRVNCAAIPEHLLESELFGYAEGAFTGAKKGGQAGKFEQAHGGTIFLDEISEMPMHMQAKLLRVLQEKEITPLGSSNTKRIDMRVIAATNVNLQELVREGKLRTDLYYRLNIVQLVVPPLRDRVGDIYFIAKHLVDNFNAEFEMDIKGLTPEAWDVLKAYGFPGNIRELRNAIESAFNVAMGSHITVEDLPPHIVEASGVSLPHGEGAAPSSDFAEGLGQKSLQEVMEEVEKRLIEQSLDLVEGNKLSAANLLGISRPGLYKKLQKYRLQ